MALGSDWSVFLAGGRVENTCMSLFFMIFVSPPVQLGISKQSFQESQAGPYKFTSVFSFDRSVCFEFDQCAVVEI